MGQLAETVIPGTLLNAAADVLVLSGVSSSHLVSLKLTQEPGDSVERRRYYADLYQYLRPLLQHCLGSLEVCLMERSLLLNGDDAANQVIGCIPEGLR